MIATVRAIERRSRRTMMLFGLTGMVAVTVHNLRLWRRDSQMLASSRQASVTCPTIRLTHFPRVSVLVAAWNESDHIDQHIASFHSLTYPNIELIVCAGGDDDTYVRASQHACERVIVLEQRQGDGKQRSLHRCLERATGEIIYFTDADCRYNDDALVRLLAPIINDGEHVTTGTSCPLDGQYDRIVPLHVWAADVASNIRQPDYVNGLLGRNAAASRAALDQIGGLNFVAKTGTDYQLARRLLAGGFRIRFVGSSVVMSEYPATIHAYRRKQSRWLRNLILHGPRFGARDDVRVTQKTIGTGLAMTVAPLIALPVGVTALVPWLILLAHAATARIRYLRLACGLSGQPVPVRYLASVVPLTVLDFVVWSLPLLDLLDPRRREQW